MPKILQKPLRRNNTYSLTIFSISGGDFGLNRARGQPPRRGPGDDPLPGSPGRQGGLGRPQRLRPPDRPGVADGGPQRRPLGQGAIGPAYQMKIEYTKRLVGYC